MAAWWPGHSDGGLGASAAPTEFAFDIHLPIVQTSLSQLSGNAGDSSIGTSDEANVISETSSTSAYFSKKKKEEKMFQNYGKNQISVANQFPDLGTRAYFCCRQSNRLLGIQI